MGVGGAAYRERTAPSPGAAASAQAGQETAMTLLRTQLGTTLRGHRLRQRRTLRDVSGAARVSLGYLSEVERGQKEASSELLASICDALDVELADLLAEVSLGLRGDDGRVRPLVPAADGAGDRKSTRLNSSHANISNAVFCLKIRTLKSHIATSTET